MLAGGEVGGAVGAVVSFCACTPVLRNALAAKVPQRSREFSEGNMLSFIDFILKSLSEK